ncbi:hypothetical protein MTBLM5_470018 [Magnetospirillum sp. LM-5]|nr:hypothetical protein MTBLM5_470018 [Magnetospirillum sp. LM-5]
MLSLLYRIMASDSRFLQPRRESPKSRINQPESV